MSNVLLGILLLMSGIPGLLRHEGSGSLIALGMAAILLGCMRLCASRQRQPER